MDRTQSCYVNLFLDHIGPPEQSFKMKLISKFIKFLNKWLIVQNIGTWPEKYV
jgi:hypothetical protein